MEKNIKKLIQNSEFVIISTSNGTGIEGNIVDVISGFMNLIDNFKENSSDEEMEHLKECIEFSFLDLDGKKERICDIIEKLYERN